MRFTCAQKQLLKEADEDFRTRERASYSGGVEEKAKVIAHKLRTGELKQNNIATAATLGDEASKLLGLKEPKLNKISIYYYINSALDVSGLAYNETADFAIDIAERALPFFEARFPSDDRLRVAIDAARSGDANRAMTIADAAFYVAAWAGVRGLARRGARGRHAAAAAEAVVFAADAAARAASGLPSTIIIAGAAARAATRAGVPEEWVINRLIQYLLGEVR